MAEAQGSAIRYPADVSPFAGLPDHPGAEDWVGLARLVGPGGTAVLFRAPVTPPAEWTVLHDWPAMQMVGPELVTLAPDPEAVRLGSGDVDEMLDLVARTRPGPFLPRTVELGTYLGLRRGGVLVAMAGERFHPMGWTEISAVCTDDAHRGQGLATRLVRAIGAGIRARDETPFLHVAADNVAAIRLYLDLGFTVRREVSVLVVAAPGVAAPGVAVPGVAV